MNFFVSTNHHVSSSLNSFVRENHLTKFIAPMADLPIFFVPVFLVSSWLYWTFKRQNQEKKQDLIYIFFAMLVAILLNLFIQQIVHIKRPETFIQPILDHIPDASFPSDHAAVSFAFLLSLYLFDYKKVFWIFFPFVILMNFSRIAGGVHWFWDVVAWFVIWWFSAFIIWKFKNNSILKKISWFFLKVASIFKL